MTANAHQQTRFTVGGRPELVVRFATCQWIDGEPRPDDACKCGQPVAEPGSPYCAAHARRASYRSGGGDG